MRKKEKHAGARWFCANTSLNGNEEDHEGNKKRNKKTQASRKPRAKRQMKTSEVWNHHIENDDGKNVCIFNRASFWK